MSDNQVQLDIEDLILSTNIVEDLSDTQRAHILQRCNEDYEYDEDSREDFLDNMDKWESHVKLELKKKSYPWPDASNVMYPLIAIACIQFNARAYPALIPSNKNMVSSRVIGLDPTGEKTKKATRTAKYMSWQFMYDIPGWEEGMDKTLLMLPAYGTVFKKTFYNSYTGKITSYHISPRNLVVNAGCDSLAKAPRVSEILPDMSERDIKERIRSGLWEEAEHLEQDEGLEGSKVFRFIEQHCYLDLDGDGYEEPYIVTFHPKSSYLARIVARFTEKDIKRAREEDEEEVIYRIDGEEFYTKYSFIPSLDGSFYDLGFGELMFSTNETVNTLINQLVDSGRLNNLQSGFIGKGIKIKQGDTALRPGEWRQIASIGEDLRKNIVPLPTNEPSNVLFQLLGMLISAGKEIASVAEIFTGKMPGQNTPATTTMASIEQGMKVFTAIYKRVYRSLEVEFKRVFYLNNVYLDEKQYVAVLDGPVDKKDFDMAAYDVCPSADPTVSSQAEAILKAKALIELIPLGLPPQEVLLRNLEAMEVPNIEKLIPGLAETGEPAPQEEKPDPKLLEMQHKQQLEAEKGAMKSQQEAEKHQMAMSSEQGKAAMDMQMKANDLEYKQDSQSLDLAAQQAKQQIFIEGKQAELQLQKEKAKSKSQGKSS